MQLILASANSGKIKEFRELIGDEIKPFSEVMEPFEIIEDADSFAGNALIKARAVYRGLTSDDLLRSNESSAGLTPTLTSDDLLRSNESSAANELSAAKENNYIVISDDSGISVPLLKGEPGIYSARYAGEDATAQENLEKLIKEVGKLTDRTPAYYTAAIAIVSRYGEYVVHGWMHGDVITEARGSNGFGYDPIFIPEGYDKTLAELDNKVKASISHRVKALELAKPIIDMLRRSEELEDRN